jgi:P4 family phage/plasmid primase-like protien
VQTDSHDNVHDADEARLFERLATIQHEADAAKGRGDHEAACTLRDEGLAIIRQLEASPPPASLAAVATPEAPATTTHLGVKERGEGETLIPFTPRKADGAASTLLDGLEPAGESRHAVRRFLSLLGTTPREVRVLRKVGAPHLGVFDSVDLAVAAIGVADMDPATIGIYVGLNPTTRPVTNVLAFGRRGAGTSDTDVCRREWLLIDLDPIRRQNGGDVVDQKAPATDAEHDLAIERGHASAAWLVSMGVPPGAVVLGSTGNGAAVLIRVDMPNDEGTKRLAEQLLAAVALWQADAGVKVDSTVANASRITRALGTMNRKGDVASERPHRQSRLLDTPADQMTCPRDVLERIAALAAPNEADAGAASNGGARFDVAAWITEHDVPADGPHEWNGTSGKGRKWIVRPCPFNATHDNGSAVIIEHANGAFSFRCHHDSCAANGWHALRDRLEPGWRERAAARTAGRQPHKTDLGNSERFAALHAADLRHCRVWNRWMVWNGVRWAHDQTGEHARRAKATVNIMYAEAAAIADEANRKTLIQHALASESATRLDALVKLASSEPAIAVAPSQFDTDHWLLNVANGTLDLRTGVLREHRREDYISKLAPVAYDPAAPCPAFLAFLDSIFPGDPALISFIQRAAGYSLVGDTRERVMFVLHGGGKNGKSTLLLVLATVLGDYAQDTHTNTLLVKHGDAIPNDLAALVNVRFVTASEVEEGRRLAEALVKKITGDEMISARFMRGEWFNYRPQFKLWLATNHKPVIRGSDDAIWDRICLVPFTVRFVDPIDDDAGANAPRMDKTLRTKLLAEAPGILRWAVEGCLAWQRDGLGAPPSVKQATGDYRDEMDHVRDFLDECCIRGEGFTSTTAELFARFVVWCKASRERTMTRQAFAARLDKLGIGKQPKTNGERSRGVRHGITLRNDAAVSFTS